MASSDGSVSSLSSESDEISSENSDRGSDSQNEYYWGEEEDELGARPYMYEPELGDRDSEHGAGDESDFDADVAERDERLGNSDWCTCGGCQPMPTARENICCQEIDPVKNVTDSFVLDLDCVLDHPGFRTICLDRWVLDTAYRQYREQYGGHRQEGIEKKKYRHTAYRQLARWCWGYLGRRVRVTLPACAVLRIRETYPSDDGHYKGFSEVFSD